MELKIVSPQDPQMPTLIPGSVTFSRVPVFEGLLTSPYSAGVFRRTLSRTTGRCLVPILRRESFRFSLLFYIWKALLYSYFREDFCQVKWVFAYMRNTQNPRSLCNHGLLRISSTTSWTLSWTTTYDYHGAMTIQYFLMICCYLKPCCRHDSSIIFVAD